MSWTEERIETLRTMWEGGQTASQIAEALGGVSRNAVIGKAHRLALQARPSPVVSKEAAAKAAPTPAPAPVAEASPPTPASAAVVAPPPAPVFAAPPPPAPEPEAAEPEAPEPEAPEPEADAPESVVAARERAPTPAPAPARPAASEPKPITITTNMDPKPAGDQPVLRSVGPGGFLRQSPGEQQPPSTPAPPRRLVPARPSAEIAGKTSLLELSDKVCKWPLGHPGEPDFHFCGDKVNPGFPYCVTHCGHAYQAQLPRRDRRAPPIPFGGPRMR